jgi:secreted trypsin-like serine protease
VSRRALLLTLGLGACAPSSDREATAPIIGGTSSGDAAIVMLVSYPADQSVLDTCTAAVIAPKVLLTAAHCVDPATHAGHTFGVFTGADASASPTPAMIGPKLVPIAKATMHPDYDPAPPFHADIAIVELTTPLDVAPLPIVRTSIDPSIAGEKARIVGYGETHYDDPNYARFTADTIIAAIDAGDTITVGDSMHKSCIGDSGGPALVAIDGVETIVGVDSYSDLAGCLQPAHYRRVDTYGDFIVPFVPTATGAGGAGGGASTSATSSGAGGSAKTADGGCAIQPESSRDGVLLFCAASAAACWILRRRELWGRRE